MRVQRVAALVLVLLIVLLPRIAAGQAPPSASLERAIEAYRNLDYDIAAAQLESLVASAAGTGLSDGARVRALMYLGATELFRERHDAAASAFTNLLLLDPGYRPDELIFPPEVSSRFHDVRRGVRAVGVIVPDSARISSGDDAFAVRLHASSPHDVRVVVLDGRGSPVRLLHEGAMGDSLDLRWSGRDGLGRLHDSGPYRIEVTSASLPGAAPRVVVVRLLLERIVPDTLPLPTAQFMRRPETQRGERRYRPLIVGLVGAAAVAALPAVADGGEAMPVRFTVAGAMLAGGIGGIMMSVRPRPITGNIQWNRQQADAWQREVARVRAENVSRRAGVRLRIVADRPRVLAQP